MKEMAPQLASRECELNMDSLVTPRLLLEPFTEEHFADLHALNSEPAVMHFLDGVRTPEESRAELLRILAAAATPGLGGWAVRRREDGVFIGRCGIKRSVETAEHELLYAYRRAFWGQGFAAESAAAVLQHTFSLGVPLVIACAVPENTASIAVMQRIGMRFSRRAQMYGRDMAVYCAERGPSPGQRPGPR